MKIGIIIVAIIVILFVLGIMTSSPPSPTNEEQVFKQNKVWSFDINPAKHVLYYLAESENQTANKNLVLGKYDLQSGNKTIIDANIPYAYATLTWLSITKDNTLFILDDGENPSNFTWEEENNPQLLEYNDSGKINTYKIINKVIEIQEKDNVDCKDIADVLSQSRNRQFIGMEKVNNEFMPAFALVDSADGSKQAYYLANCNPASLAQFKGEFFDNNISIVNKKVFEDTSSATEYLWVDTEYDFSYKSQKKSITTLETGCEKYYGLVEWNGKKMNTGSCVHGILGFASSGNLFYEGNVIYAKKDGIYTLTQ